jgi:hypothetical protein
MATPLEQRQWRRGAQRALRLALIAVKDARGRYDAAARACYAAAGEAANAALAAAYLSDSPLGALKALPCIEGAARRKLGAAQAAALARADASAAALAGMAAEMADAAVGLLALLEVAGPSVGSPQGAPPACADSDAGLAPPPVLGAAAWQRNEPLFACIPLPQAAAMLSELAEAHARNAFSIRRVVFSLTAVAAAVAASDGGALAVRAALPASSAASPPPPVARLKEALAVHLALLLLRPLLDDGRCELLLATLTGEMAGF